MGFPNQAYAEQAQQIRGAGQAIGGVDMLATPQRPPEMSRVLERLSCCNVDLHQALSSLEQRLEPILNGPSTVENKAEKAPTPVRCALGAAIERESDAIYEAARRVHALLDRLAI